MDKIAEINDIKKKIYVDLGFVNDMHYSNKLYKYNELRKKNVDFDPIMTISHTYGGSRYTVNSKLRERVSEFNGLPFSNYLKKYNFVLAGGSVYSIIHSYHINDYDFFIIGRDDIKNRLIGFINEIIEPNATIYATKNCITITNNIKVQIILRIYNSIHEILNDFDVGDIMMCFDGNDVFVNEEGKFTHETGYKIINLNKYSHTYVKRLTRFFARYIVHTNLKPGGKTDLVVYKDIENDYKKYYDKCIYETEQVLGNNLYSIANKKDFLITTVERLDEILSDNIPLNIIYKLSVDISCKPEIIKEMNKLAIFSESEISDYIDSCIAKYGGNEYDCGFNTNEFEQVVNDKIKSLNLTIPFVIEDGPYTKNRGISVYDFYGEDGIEYNQDIKIALK